MTSNLPQSQLLDPYSNGLNAGYNDIFVPFLGPPPRSEEKSRYQKRNVDKWNAPEIYIGKSEYLGETIEDYMLTADQTWMTERVMPLRRTVNIHVSWQKWEYNPHYMGPTPHQTMSMIVTSRRQARSFTMTRRGLGVEFEDDFVKNEEGRSRFMGSIMQLARSIPETANVEGLRALLSAHVYTQEYERQHGVLAATDLEAYFNRQEARFMIAQKDAHGLEMLNTEINSVMEMYRGTANTWIFSRDVMDYCDLAPSRTYYDYGGQQAVDRLNGVQIGQAAAGNTMGNVDSLAPLRNIKGTTVYLAKSYYVEGTGNAELLSRDREVGVFNTMIDRCRDYSLYTSASRAIRVYDNTNDKWAVITLDMAIEHCIMWNTQSGYVIDPFVNLGKRGRKQQAASMESQVQWDNDFLSYSSNDKETGKQYGRQDVRFVGDLDMKWFTRRQMENAGRTLVNALNRNMAAKPQMSGFARDTVNEQLENILGNDNLFFQNKAQIGRPGTGATDNTNYKVIFNAANEDELRNISSSITPQQEEERHQAFFKEQLFKLVKGKDAVQRLEPLAADASRHWKERAKDITESVQTLLGEDASKVKHKDAGRISTWVNERVSNYENELAAWKASAASSSSSSTGQNVISVPIGQPLPEGCTYLNDNERKKALGLVKDYPTSLYDLREQCPHLFVGASPSSSSIGARRQTTSRFAPIGADIRLQRARAEEGFPQNQRGTQAPLNERFRNLEKRVQDIAKGSAPALVKYCAIMFLGTQFQKDRFMALADADILVPVNFLLLRPHALYQTRYGIKCQAGECGNIFYGAPDVQVGNEMTRKVGAVHMTMYMTAQVLDDTKVYVVEDVFCKRYRGGMGIDFWTLDEYRASMANRTHRSIICTMLPFKLAGTQQSLEKRIDIRGQWYVQPGLKATTSAYQQPCYPGGFRTAAALGWDPAFQRGASGRFGRIPINYKCCQAVQFHANTKTDSWGDVIPEQSEFGDQVYPGCGKVRDGQWKYLKTPAYLEIGEALR